MQDNDKTQPASADPDKTPSSHEQLNRPGMTNGIPDQADDGNAKGAPHDDRHQSEIAAGGPGDQSGGSDGS